MTINAEGMRTKLQSDIAEIDQRIRDAQAERDRLNMILGMLGSPEATALADFLASQIQPPAQESSTPRAKRGPKPGAPRQYRLDEHGNPIKPGRKPKPKGDQPSLALATQEATPPASEDDGSHPHAAKGKGRKAGVASARGNEGA